MGGRHTDVTVHDIPSASLPVGPVLRAPGPRASAYGAPPPVQGEGKLLFALGHDALMAVGPMAPLRLCEKELLGSNMLIVEIFNRRESTC